MTASEIVAIVERAGGSIEAVAGDRVRVRAPAGLLNRALKVAVERQKPEILTLLGIVHKASDIARSARLLRECLWDPTSAPCAFHCGVPTERCRRCGARLGEHYP